jgi:hypothetical protein
MGKIFNFCSTLFYSTFRDRPTRYRFPVATNGRKMNESCCLSLKDDRCFLAKTNFPDKTFFPQQLEIVKKQTIEFGLHTDRQIIKIEERTTQPSCCHLAIIENVFVKPFT